MRRAGVQNYKARGNSLTVSGQFPCIVGHTLISSVSSHMAFTVYLLENTTNVGRLWSMPVTAVIYIERGRSLRKSARCMECFSIIIREKTTRKRQRIEINNLYFVTTSSSPLAKAFRRFDLLCTTTLYLTCYLLPSRPRQGRTQKRTKSRQKRRSNKTLNGASPLAAAPSGLP